jgi:hypothetical protein
MAVCFHELSHNMAVLMSSAVPKSAWQPMSWGGSSEVGGLAAMAAAVRAVRRPRHRALPSPTSTLYSLTSMLASHLHVARWRASRWTRSREALALVCASGSQPHVATVHAGTTLLALRSWLPTRSDVIRWPLRRDLS